MTTQQVFTLFGESPVEKEILDLTGKVVSGSPVQSLWCYVNDKSGKVESGIWESTAGVFCGTLEGSVEFFHVLEGEAEITDENTGLTKTVRAGDGFFMEDGVKMTWRVKNYIKKHYVVCKV